MKLLIFFSILFIFTINTGFADTAEIDLSNLDKGKYILTYEEHYFDGIGESILTIQKYNQGYLAVWKGITDTTEVYTDAEYNTYKIVFYDNNTSLTVVRQGNLLTVNGNDEGIVIKKKLTIKTPNWYQLLSFSLMPFTVSNDKKIKFALFDPYNIKVMEMEISKNKTEIISLFGEDISAVKMSMRMSGFLSLFWKSEIWNSNKNGVHLKYEGLNVIPSFYKAKIFLEKIEFQP